MGLSLIITTGGGTDTSEGNPNATADTILQGYTVYDVEGEIVTGCMEPREPAVTSLSPGGSTTLSKGYYDGTGQILATGLSNHTSATANAGHVLWNYTGWKNGSKITGTMINRGTTNGTLSANGTYTVPVGWHNGSGKVTQSLSTQGATTTNPGTSNKTVIAASKWSTGNQIVAGHGGKLVAANIKKGVTIFGVTGTFEDKPDEFVVQYLTTSYSKYGVNVVLFSANSSWTQPDGYTFPVILGNHTFMAFEFDNNVWTQMFVTANVRGDTRKGWGRICIYKWQYRSDWDSSTRDPVGTCETLVDTKSHQDRYYLDTDVGWISLGKISGTRFITMESVGSLSRVDFFQVKLKR